MVSEISTRCDCAAARVALGVNSLADFTSQWCICFPSEMESGLGRDLASQVSCSDKAF